MEAVQGEVQPEVAITVTNGLKELHTEATPGQGVGRAGRDDLLPRRGRGAGGGLEVRDPSQLGHARDGGVDVIRGCWFCAALYLSPSISLLFKKNLLKKNILENPQELDNNDSRA